MHALFPPRANACRRSWTLHQAVANRLAEQPCLSDGRTLTRSTKPCRCCLLPLMRNPLWQKDPWHTSTIAVATQSYFSSALANCSGGGGCMQHARQLSSASMPAWADVLPDGALPATHNHSCPECVYACVHIPLTHTCIARTHACTRTHTCTDYTDAIFATASFYL